MGIAVHVMYVQVRDWLRVIASNKDRNVYELRYVSALLLCSRLHVWHGIRWLLQHYERPYVVVTAVTAQSS